MPVLPNTVYLSNLPYSLTNCDVRQLLEKHGRIIKVTVVKDKEMRKSRGVAFVQFAQLTSAEACVEALNNSELSGRTVKASIAIDNGRSEEFSERRNYPSKVRCYECGEFGHLSYKCERNTLGDAEPPVKRKKKPKKSKTHLTEKGGKLCNKRPHCSTEDHDDSENSDDEATDSLSYAIHYEQQMAEAGGSSNQRESHKRARFQKSGYFSDEEELVDD